jgi:hypothetical protein
MSLEEVENPKEEAQSLTEKREDRLCSSAESLLGKPLHIFYRLLFSSMDIYVLLLPFMSCLGVADTPVDHLNKLQFDSMADAISFGVDSNEQVQGLLKKTKATLLKLYALVFPKLSQEKTLWELAEAFFVDNNDFIEAPKRSSRLYGSLLSFHLMMGYFIKAEFEELSKVLPKEEDDTAIDLTPFARSARKCVR